MSSSEIKNHQLNMLIPELVPHENIPFAGPNELMPDFDENNEILNYEEAEKITEKIINHVPNEGFDQQKSDSSPKVDSISRKSVKTEKTAKSVKSVMKVMLIFFYFVKINLLN